MNVTSPTSTISLPPSQLGSISLSDIAHTAVQPRLCNLMRPGVGSRALKSKWDGTRTDLPPPNDDGLASGRLESQQWLTELEPRRAPVCEEEAEGGDQAQNRTASARVTPAARRAIAIPRSKGQPARNLRDQGREGQGRVTGEDMDSVDVSWRHTTWLYTMMIASDACCYAYLQSSGSILEWDEDAVHSFLSSLGFRGYESQIKGELQAENAQVPSLVL